MVTFWQENEKVEDGLGDRNPIGSINPLDRALIFL
jgi:hypothetical protein